MEYPRLEDQIHIEDVRNDEVKAVKLLSLKRVMSLFVLISAVLLFGSGLTSLYQSANGVPSPRRDERGADRALLHA